MFTQFSAWINKSDIFITDSHEIKACELLNTTLKKQNRKYHFSAYSILFRLGYIRVFCVNNNGYFVEYWQGAKLSSFQKSIIDNANNKNDGKINLYIHEFNI